MKIHYLNNHLLEKTPGWLHPNEGGLLYHFASRLKARATIVEIGSFLGKSTGYLAYGLRDGRGGQVVSVDPHLGKTGTDRKINPTWKEFNHNLIRLDITKIVKPIRKTSVNANKNWKNKIDLLHIDGLHDYQNIKLDLDIWLPFLRTGGVVVCHDTFGPSYPGVAKAVTEVLLNSSNFSQIGVCGSAFFAAKGKPSSLFEKLNLYRSKFFIHTAMQVYSSTLPINTRNFLVNFVLKIFILNQFSTENLIHKVIGV